MSELGAADPHADLCVTVASRTLVALLDPLHSDPWDVGGVTADQVTRALGEGRLRADNPCWSGEPPGADEHAERVAWLVRHGWDRDEPFHLDVDLYGGVCLNDGNHRLYALAYQGRVEPVVVAISGFIDIAEEVLGVNIP
jgi:hypothetical protein